MPGLRKVTPVIVIVGLVVCATKEYHTSRVTPLAQLGVLIVVVEVPTPYKFPGTVRGLVLGIKGTALAHTSFASVIQIVKVAAVLLLEKILT
jgi:hypothetical protein